MLGRYSTIPYGSGNVRRTYKKPNASSITIAKNINTV